MLKIVTFKWDAGLHPKKGLKFGAYHVEVLFNMLKRYLQIPFELICVTDQPKEFHYLRDNITVLPLWSWGRNYSGCFRRLKLFDPEIRKIIGDRFVMIDLDVVITGDITPLFQRKEDFIIWGEQDRKNPYCGSLLMLSAGTRKHIWDSFDINAYPCMRSNGTYPLGTDQRHIYLKSPGEAMWSRADGIYNFGFDIRINDRIMRASNSRRRGLKGMAFYLNRIKNPLVRGGTGELPAHARLVFFNGKDDPSQSYLQEHYPWIKEHWK